MTRFSATAIAAVLFCLFILSTARIPPSTDDDTSTTSVALPTVSGISLSGEGSDQTQTESDSSTAVASVPLTTVTFRPINHRFIMRSRHPCRHHFKLDPSTMEIPYSNDMIVASGENSDFEDPTMIHGGRRQRVRMHHHLRHHHHHDEHSDSDSDSDDDDDDQFKRITIQRHDLDRFDRMEDFKDWSNKRKHSHVQEEEKEENHGFIKRVLKLFDHYF